MRLCTIVTDQGDRAGVVTAEGIVPVEAINAYLGRSWATDLHAMITQGLSPRVLDDAKATPVKLDPAGVRFGLDAEAIRGGLTVGAALQDDSGVGGGHRLFLAGGFGGPERTSRGAERVGYRRRS